MILSAIAHIFSALLELIRITHLSDHSEGFNIIRTPIKALNAYAERWVKSLRSECP